MAELPEELSRIIHGFQESRVMLTAIELDLFTALGRGSTADEVAVRVGCDPRATGLLLDALSSMGVIQKRGESYRPTEVTAKFLVAGTEGDVISAMTHIVDSWKNWSNLTETVRTGQAVAVTNHAHRGETWTRSFIAAMHRKAGERARHVVSAVGTAGVRTLLDVGGGSGAYAIEFARAKPDLQAEVLDLETVLPITRKHIEEAELDGRVRTKVGDLRSDTFGEGWDLVLLSAICHMLDERENENLIRRCAASLAPGGRLLVQDFILDPDGTAPRIAALFSINMLVVTRGGRNYTEAEYRGWMEESGLSVERLELPGPTDLIVGTLTSG